MSLEEEVVELSQVYHGQKERMQAMEELLRDYYELIDTWGLSIASHVPYEIVREVEQKQAEVQQRAKALLGE